jgi:hypothetical protein
MKRECWLKIFTLVMLAGIFVAFASIPVILLKESVEISRDCAALELTKDVLCEYLERHQGTWPDSWEHLEKPFLNQNNAIGDRWTVDELKSVVWIRFDRNNPGFGLVSGRTVKWIGADPRSEVFNKMDSASTQNKR